ncbi:Hypothetical protein MYEA_2290 [Mycoplasma yeatsii 13926]|uniref:Transmembrane protein n=1 Tax=Mycoplasma yeatsii 13926 TaxID=1188240 RepID=S6G3N2_9MOLU|nr:hypothetical protein [Mycoplasma yeatsii]EOA07361.1 Hypothetical protein MYEA_2290 [Mycoplasma yeatsii 13926]
MNEQIINDQTINEQITKPKKISDLYKAGAIISLIAAILVLLLCIVYFANSFIQLINLISANRIVELGKIDPASYATLKWTLIIIIIFLPFIMAASSISIYLSTKTLTNQTYEHKIALSVLSIIFGLLFGIIGGTFMLIADHFKCEK